ncbi:MAG TPA: ATP-binding protein [Verrucomicrobiae bacterium]|nr:ATP-binding protein [Verrucomicrobiae bacterium]
MKRGPRSLAGCSKQTRPKQTSRGAPTSEEQFRLAVQSVAEYAICMLDRRGRIMSWNTGGERLTGWTAANAIGQPLHSRLIPDEAPTGATRHELKDAAAKGQAPNRAWCTRKDGSKYYATWVITAVRDSARRLTGYLVIARDMTGRKQCEDEISRWNAELERSVTDRTAQLESANQELEAFSHSVSHDLRAPLRHIDGFVEMLRNHAARQLDDVGKEYLQIISDSARQMGKLIDDLLGFSRMARVKLNTRSVNPSALVQEIVRQRARELQNRRVEWSIADLPRVPADPDLLRQVLVNLIDNALKYTSTREVTRIEIGATIDAHETIFFIRDNGVGFEMRYVDKLFRVFQRLHRSSDFEGSGVGLSHVRRIIHRHAGRTWAEGAVNRGATFYFSLPNAKESER